MKLSVSARRGSRQKYYKEEGLMEGEGWLRRGRRRGGGCFASIVSVYLCSSPEMMIRFRFRE